ncbi:ribulokinase [Holotrichia oblita]|uniref:Ribulokinase n=1 Tax=Holotrichia oblita TaxID=644536 RepID=A0ACB9T5X9_HOLOL|nr:ribulokinase [Holotrichia oblita]
MRALLALLIAITLLNYVHSVPVPNTSGIKIDQRQEGDINVRADLENFVILIIPTTSSNFGLIDLLSKAIPIKNLKRKHQIKQHQGDLHETQNFIESKTAPYHVDISQSKLKLEPNVEKNEDILNSRSKNEEKRELGRFAKAILVTVPLDGKEDLVKDESRRISGQLHLIGSEYDQCGPDGYRNKEGTCVYVPGEVFV